MLKDIHKLCFMKGVSLTLLTSSFFSPIIIRLRTNFYSQCSFKDSFQAWWWAPKGLSMKTKPKPLNKVWTDALLASVFVNCTLEKCVRPAIIKVIVLKSAQNVATQAQGLIIQKACVANAIWLATTWFERAWRLKQMKFQINSKSLRRKVNKT